MRMRERLYLTEDRSEAVVEEDRRGRHLLCKKGAELDDRVAAKYGLVDGDLPEAPAPAAEVIFPPEVKRAVEKIVAEGIAKHVKRSTSKKSAPKKGGK